MARTFKLNGIPISVKTGWSISDKINARSVLSCVLLDGQFIKNGESITLEVNNKVIFAGYVKKSQRKETEPGYLETTISVMDNASLADKRIIAKVYENELAGNIVKDLIAEKLIDETITNGTIEDGPLIRKAVFNYVKVSQALDYLKNLTGFIWNVDIDRKLNFHNRQQFKSPFDLNDTLQHRKFIHNQNMNRYRNSQYVRGGKGETAQQINWTPTPAPDGETRSFVLRFELSDKPVIEVNIDGNGWTTINPNDIGIDGKDTGKKWYYKVESNIVTQDTSETVLRNSEPDGTGTPTRIADKLRMTYTGLRNIFTSIEDITEIDNRKTIESGTSGLYENLISNDAIQSSSQAVEFAQGQIETYGEIADKVTFETSESGLEAGQLLKINKMLYNINTDFLIETVKITADGPSNIKYSVTALDSPAIGGWEEFFKEITQKQADFVINENEVIILLVNQVEKNAWSGMINIKEGNALYPKPTLYPSPLLFPGSLTKEVNLND